MHTKEPPERLAKTAGHEIESLGREYPFWTGTIAEVMSRELAKERVTAMLSGFFAFLAVLLACVGLYGLTSYTVTRRTREIGIRVALGAQRVTVLWIVLRETLVLALFGIAIGIPSALVATRLIASMLFGISDSDLPTITGVSLLLLLVALFAGFLPAPFHGARGVEKRRSDFSLPVAIGEVFTAPPQSGLAWFCFLFPLIAPDMPISGIRRSEKAHGFAHGRLAVRSVRLTRPYTW